MGDTPERVLLVGESNPYSDDPYFALYPKPEGASGYRLAVLILGMKPRDYLDTFDRVDLLPGDARWSIPTARAAAAALTHRRRVLLGAKVTAAHGFEFMPFTGVNGNGWRGVVWPHPSGRNAHLWTPAAIAQARMSIANLLAASTVEAGR